VTRVRSRISTTASNGASRAAIASSPCNGSLNTSTSCAASFAKHSSAGAARW
jgi:hypothetical protein